MTRLSTLYGAATSIRRDRQLTLDELMRVAPGKSRKRRCRKSCCLTVTMAPAATA